MEPTTPTTQTPPAGGNDLKTWFDRLPPRLRAAVLAALIFAGNAGLSLLWGYIAPGAKPPQIPPPAPVVVNVGPGHDVTPAAK